MQESQRFHRVAESKPGRQLDSTALSGRVKGKEVLVEMNMKKETSVFAVRLPVHFSVYNWIFLIFLHLAFSFFSFFSSSFFASFFSLFVTVFTTFFSSSVLLTSCGRLLFFLHEMFPVIFKSGTLRVSCRSTTRLSEEFP